MQLAHRLAGEALHTRLHGHAPLYVESGFEGTLVAPSAEVTLRAINQASHYGQYFARTLHVDAGAKVVHNVQDCE